MKKINTLIFLLTILITSISIVPSLAKSATADTAPKLDYSGFVKCDGVISKDEPGRQRACDFAALIDTINKLINWLFIISIPIATVMFAYAGLLYMTGTSGNRTKANSIFTSVGKGFIIMIVAWLAVYTIVNWFVKPNFGATFFLEQKK